MFKVISDLMAHWYDMWNTIVIAIIYCNAMKMNCAFLFVKLLLLQLISAIQRKWFVYWCIS